MSNKTNHNGEPITILVAEDSRTQAEQVCCTLEAHGYTVFLAQNGREGIEMTRAHRPTLIISDVVMPEMDGYEFCHLVKQDPDLKSTPVMLLTSLSDPVDVMRGLECGADNFLVKPYEERYLISRVSYMLSNYNLRETEYTKMGVEIFFSGNRYFITSERLQILNLLLSTYETAVQKNRELLDARNDLQELAESLDEKVRERTVQLEAEIEERRAAEEKLRQSVEAERKLAVQLQQAQKMEAIGRLAGGIAHDFNNLLTVINGCCQMLIAECTENEEAHELLLEICQAGERAASLTRQLLAFGRKAIVQPQRLNLNHLIRELEKMISRLIGEDIDIATKFEPELFPIYADVSQIEQILINLAVNARDAMPKGGKLTIETHNIHLDEPYANPSVEIEPGTYAMIAISDNGHGMDKETQAHIFEPFFTTKAVGKGTGLGLATIYGIIKQLDGFVTVYSELDKGTTFKIFLPVIDKDVASPIPISTPSCELPKGTEHILLVEDEKGVRNLTRIILESAGYKVLVCAEGEEAIQIANNCSEPIDLLLTDVIMPKMSGSQVHKAMLEKYPDIKAIFMSGYTDDAILRNGVMSTATPFLQKPFTPGMLTKKIREVLDQ